MSASYSGANSAGDVDVLALRQAGVGGGAFTGRRKRGTLGRRVDLSRPKEKY